MAQRCSWAVRQPLPPWCLGRTGVASHVGGRSSSWAWGEDGQCVMRESKDEDGWIVRRILKDGDGQDVMRMLKDEDG